VNAELPIGIRPGPGFSAVIDSHRVRQSPRTGSPSRSFTCPMTQYTAAPNRRSTRRSDRLGRSERAAEFPEASPAAPSPWLKPRLPAARQKYQARPHRLARGAIVGQAQLDRGRLALVQVQLLAVLFQDDFRPGRMSPATRSRVPVVKFPGRRRGPWSKRPRIIPSVTAPVTGNRPGHQGVGGQALRLFPK
jgi:hypothetical protein